jgi:hypothetical protein
MSAEGVWKVKMLSPYGWEYAVNIKALIFVLITVLVVPVGAQGQEEESDKHFPQQLSALGLLTTCASSSLTETGRSRQRYCRGFVSGVEEAVRLLELRVPGSTSFTLCVPAGTTSSVLADVFIRHASRAGVDLTRPAALVVLDALTERFTC